MVLGLLPGGEGAERILDLEPEGPGIVFANWVAGARNAAADIFGGVRIPEVLTRDPVWSARR